MPGEIQDNIFARKFVDRRLSSLRGVLVLKLIVCPWVIGMVKHRLSYVYAISGTYAGSESE